MNSESVTVIGLGGMGSALASALLKAGHKVTVWNRSSDKAQVLVAEGANLASSPVLAVSASSLIILAVVDYAAAHEILEQEGVAEALKQRTLVMMSTGTGEQAAVLAEWIQNQGAEYLDGGLLSYPRSIGNTSTGMLYSGSKLAFEQHAHTLSAMAGAQQFIDDDVTASNTIGLGLWSFYFGSLAAFFEGAAWADRIGDMKMHDFLPSAKAMMATLLDGMEDASARMRSEDYSGNQASVDLHLHGMELLCGAFSAAGLPSKVNEAFVDYLQMARKAGDGSKDVVTAFNALRQSQLYN
ncbi:NAD(P)-dependent oxidoreductase [Photobacterium sanguinicancri]|uniref:NAD(P)-dependent oxidoreductase n=1 Tax=Photobacterium sanguinicancri TaxID=875932 RepID=UPI003D10336F